MRAGPYVPQPGTIPHKVVTYLQAQVDLGRHWVPGAELCEHVGQPSISPFLTSPIRHGVIVSRRKPDNQRQSEYALGDGTPLPVAHDQDDDEPAADRPPRTPARPAALPWPPATTRAVVQPAKRGRKKSQLAPEAAIAPAAPAQEVKRPMRGQAQNPTVFADVLGMSIVDDPVIARVVGNGDKYGPLFVQMKLGQAIKCQPADAPKVAGALRKWIGERKLPAIARSVRRYPADGLGRVWLLPAKGGAK